ncbi:uncharacterized protein LOC143892109 [Tasmannia lanceolata]|uniref:uncharacterized protein LOC143892109 n=1 Tax=Tasmannia lanceolata TaxID=3420 RepID=UPI0040639CB8
MMKNQSDRDRNEYRIRLNAPVDYVRFLQQQGLPFRGRDESDDSNQGNFLELLRFLAEHNDDINRVVLQNAPENLKLIAPDIRKDIAMLGQLKLLIPMNSLGDALFSILVDESRVISMKEQVVIVLRYVDLRGRVIECFLGITHVTDTTALTLKETIESMLAKDGLSIARLCGQGYDGASNMRGQLDGLKTSILLENSSAIMFTGITNELLQALQRKDQDIVNAMKLVNISKQRLQDMRESGWSSLFEDVCTFCGKHDIVVPNMEEMYLPRCRSRRKARKVTNLHHYCADLYYSVIDMQLQELNNRFDETNT